MATRHVGQVELPLRHAIKRIFLSDCGLAWFIAFVRFSEIY